MSISELSYNELRKLASEHNLNVGSNPTKSLLIKQLTELLESKAKEVVDVEILELPKKQQTLKNKKAMIESKVESEVSNAVSNFKFESLDETIAKYQALIPVLFEKAVNKAIAETSKVLDDVLEVEAEEVSNEVVLNQTISTSTSNVTTSNVLDDDELELELMNMDNNGPTSPQLSLDDIDFDDEDDESDEDEDNYDDEDDE